MDKEHRCPNCEYHRQRANRWRAEAYKLGGYDGIELPWVGLTDEERYELLSKADWAYDPESYAVLVEAKLKEKNT